MKARQIMSIAAALTAALLMLSTGPAGADSGEERYVANSIPADDKTGVPTHIYTALNSVHGQLGEAFNSYEWDELSQKILIHFHGDNKILQQKIASVLAAEEFVLVPDKFSRQDLEEEAWRLASSGATINNKAIVSAGPLSDSSGLQISIEGEPDSRAPLPEADDVSIFPVDLNFSPRPEVSSRQYDFYAPHWGGALMNRPAEQPGLTYTCSTGFGVTYFSDTGPKTDLLTADHCGPTGSVWETGNYSGDQPILGTMMATNAVGTDIKRISGSTFAGIIYGGPDTSNAGIGIKGTIPGILNDSYCYSGSQSGIVCSNIVSSLNQTVCYKIFQCYRNMVYTDQASGLSAAGNGDSGGPVITYRNSEAYAVGIISGMFGASPNTCAGVPGTPGYRECSSALIMAPIEAFFQDNPNYVIGVF